MTEQIDTDPTTAIESEEVLGLLGSLQCLIQTWIVANKTSLGEAILTVGVLADELRAQREQMGHAEPWEPQP